MASHEKWRGRNTDTGESATDGRVKDGHKNKDNKGYRKGSKSRDTPNIGNRDTHEK
jgi:hypothetical protein